MKATAGGFAASPARLQAVAVALVHGPDEAKVRDVAACIRAALAADAPGGFGFAELTQAPKSAVLTHLQTIPFGGGRAVAELHEASDRLAGLADEVLARPPGGLLLLLGGELRVRAKLRVLVEQSPAGLAIACTAATAADIEQAWRAVLAADSVRVTPDGAEALTRFAEGDLASARALAEKVALFVGAGGEADAALVETVCDAGGEGDLDEAALAALTGVAGATDGAGARLAAQATSAVTIVRGLMQHTARLRTSAGLRERGASPREAMEGVRPPVWQKDRDRFARAASAWNGGTLDGLMGDLLQAERLCKTTGIPADTVVQHLLMDVADRAKGGAKRPRS